MADRRPYRVGYLLEPLDDGFRLSCDRTDCAWSTEAMRFVNLSDLEHLADTHKHNGRPPNTDELLRRTDSSDRPMKRTPVRSLEDQAR